MKLILKAKPVRLALWILITIVFLLPGTSLNPLAPSGKKPMTLQDIMKFKAIYDPSISENGQWVAYEVRPDRGNGEVIIYNIETKNRLSIPRGSKATISKDSRWAAAGILPDFSENEKAKPTEKPKPGMSLLDTSSGKIINFEKVKGFAFSDDSSWLVYALFPEEKKPEEKKAEEKKPGEIKPEEVKPSIEKPAEPKPGEKKPGEKNIEKPQETSTVILRHLATGNEIRLEKVGMYALDPSGHYIAYSTWIENDDPKTPKNGLYTRNLFKNGQEEQRIHSFPAAKYSNLAWSKKKSLLAFLFHENIEPKPEEKQPNGDEKKTQKKYTSSLMTWDGISGKLTPAVPADKIPGGWLIPAENTLIWTEDGTRLFFGFKPVDEYLWTQPAPPAVENKETKPATPTPDADLYSIDKLLEKRGVDVWHWNDPLINSHQKLAWEEKKKKTYLAVYHLAENRFVPLTDKNIPDLRKVENPDFALALSNIPYQKEQSWDTYYMDVYLTDLKSGSKRPVLTRFAQDFYLSFHGRFILYYQNKNWFLYDARLSNARNLTQSIEVPFYREEYDSPDDVPGYGTAGWTENDASVLIYDKYDIWQFFTTTGKKTCITAGEGRKNKITFRILKLDPEEKFFKSDQPLILSAYSDTGKYTAFYTAQIGKEGVKEAIREPKRFTFAAKAKNAPRILYTRESFEEFPDLWVSDLEFTKPQKISEVNPEKENYLWGKAELFQWQSLDGLPLDGIVIKPEDYDPSKRYPVLVYFYEKMSQLLYNFNQVVINHRPCFPYYAAHGYVIFLPDIKFEIGRPGLSSLKCIVPGVQKLIETGVADPKAIGLHGHSWSGYLTAYIVTQTDIFAAAAAGAAVVNMTSAYNGIRWESGISRQFQYEKDQSRIGPSLFQAPHLYLQNSPVFFAERIRTPLLLEFGDKDGAVPWSQGIEFYLALRRLEKNCIFLQYNEEGHHPKEYANKLDYFIKLKEFFDHYLQKAPAPEWMTKGVPYRKK